MSLKDYIEYLRNQYINERITSYTEEYHLPIEYKVSSSKYDTSRWDGINTFNVKFKKDNPLVSDHEREFYKEWEKNGLDGVHIFRNGTNRNNDYFVEYIDDENKIRAFFPDFIVINEKTKNVLILEGKGGTKRTDIDKQTENKKRALVESLNKNRSKSEYSFRKAIMVSYNKKEYEATYRDIEKEEIISFNELKKIIEDY